jgi:hypothetical protein
MEAFGSLAGRLTGVLVALSVPVASLWLAWGVFKGLLTGGVERALQQLIVRALIMGVMLGVLTHLPDTVAVVAALGTAILETVLQAFQGAV